ncbi:MAG: flippase [Patescibacteria group bacterium]
MQQNIAKNTTLLTSAYIFQKIFAFIYFTLIARFLGADNIGLYVFAISFTTILSVFIDFGLTQVLIRESAKDKNKANEYLNNVLSIKILLAVLTYLAAIVIINLLNKSQITLTMVYLAGVIMIIDSFTLSFWAIFRAYQNLKYEAISITINQLLIVLVGLIGVFLKFPLYILVFALLAGSSFSFIYSFILLKVKLHFKFSFQWNKSIVKLLLKIAFPFALAAIFTRVYTFIDQVLLSILISDQAVGWYSVAYKITYAFIFLPASFAAAIYPAMSAAFANDQSKLKIIFEKSMFFLIIIALPIAFGLGSLADKIILGLYGSGYQPSILTLKILIFAIIALFLSYPVGSLLNACDKQTVNTTNMGIIMVIDIILHLILIPKYQQIGASIATLISLSLLFILNLIWVPKIIKYDFKFLTIKSIKALLASVFMAIFIIYTKEHINFIILIIISAFIYTIILYLLKGFGKDDLKYLWQAIFKKNVILPPEETLEENV